MAKPIDTKWTDFRWKFAEKFFLMAIRIAPKGTARDRWIAYNAIWAKECKAVREQYSKENNID